MEIKEALLTTSNYNRPGTKRTRTTAIACHYIGNPGTTVNGTGLTALGMQQKMPGMNTMTIGIIWELIVPWSLVCK